MEHKRIIIEKKKDVNIEAQKIKKEFNLKDVRVLNVYDLFNASLDEVKRITEELLFESPIDLMYEDAPPIDVNEKAFRVEYHKGQYNQREDSTSIMIKDFLGLNKVEVVNSKIVILKDISEEDFLKLKSYYINPIEASEVDLNTFSFNTEKDTLKDIEIVHSFIEMNEKELVNIQSIVGLAMDIDDLKFCQQYFKSKDRNPSIAELKIIDTYWSDHCRHTTFMTEITDISIEEGMYKDIFDNVLKDYLFSRNYVYENKERAICLMDLATINMKEIKKKGLLDDKEDTDEVNAASIEVDVDVDGKNEKWLLMFKNETHNHPTEMEPFGGASTCLGGGIRDPLSGRSYVYQAMRITGSGDPRVSYEQTMPGKLPQRRITQTAMAGYSSYGYQIGGTSGYISEFYDEGFIAKRLELGALVAAAPKDWVTRANSEPTDLIILVGGRTGRDGLGAAVGSSKVQNGKSLQTAGAEVQKGNPPLERKIVRLFRNPEATKLIKKCNDFGAGGVAVAVGELADGLYIELDKVPVKYPGLDGTEIALSESQERMAIVIDKQNLERFMNLVESEDLEGTVIAKVTDENRVHMVWKNKTIVDIDREFLNTNGLRKKTKVSILNPSEDIYLSKNPKHIEGSIKKDFINNMSDLNISSQKGLIERFDNTIGSGTVLMQLGGRQQLTPQEGMVAKLPVLNGETKTCSIMTCGYDPKLAKWSTFHGGYYAVIESIAKIVALGGDHKKVRLTFQEYFERLGNDSSKWGKPFTSLLGAYLVQKELDIPSIGGKDSMSGSFENINVPPSLFSFAIVTENVDNIISKEFKNIDSKVVLVNLNIDHKGMINFDELKKNYTKIKELINNKHVLSSSSIKFGGIARSIAEMSLGNRIGFEFEKGLVHKLYKPLYGSILLELDKNENIEELFVGTDYTLIGTTTNKNHIKIEEEIINLDELKTHWEKPLSDVFPIKVDIEGKIDSVLYNKGQVTHSKVKVAKPKVLIPIFTGTHGEYDMARSFEKAGAKVETLVFKTLSRNSINESYKELAKKIKECQIIGLANGSILGDEPETGGKLIKLIFSNPLLKEALNNHLNSKDGLILGVGSGLQGLIKLGLLGSTPYITHNKLGEFTSTLADIMVVSNLSPWMNEMNVGDIYTAPVATKEGRIIVENQSELFKNGQIATQFIKDGLPSYDGTFNPTGSEMAIDSITSLDGRVCGTVASIDRMDKDLYKNVEIKGKSRIFEGGVKYFD